MLFDLDGTLVDTKDVIVKSFVIAAETLGIEIDPEAVRAHVGYPLQDVIRAAIIGNYSSDTLEQFISYRRKVMEELWPREARLFDDVKPVLKELYSRGNVILGVASSSIQERVLRILEFFGIRGFFTVVVGVKAGIRGKPYPDIILEASRKAGIHRENTVYIGDAEVDCVCSRNAGVRFILVNRENADVNRWSCKPDYVITSLYGLLEVLDTLFR